MAICGVAGVNTPAHARSEPCAHLITVEKPQAGSLGWYALVAQGIEQRFPNTTAILSWFPPTCRFIALPPQMMLRW